MATIYEVAAQAGVSLATVSRVINKSSLVSKKTTAKVESVMKQLGYRPNAIAQSLASNRTNSIGVMVSELYGPFYGPMMSGIETHLRAASKHTIITAGHSNERDELDGIEFLIGRKCDALILHVEAVSDDYLIELSKGPVPVVLINRHIPAIKDHCISLDNQYGSYLATQSVIDQGHRQLACISGPLWKHDARERLLGHKKALAERQIEFDAELWFEGDFRETGGSAGMTKILEQKKPFTAVICSNDEMASGAIDIIRAKGLRIPDDISVIGFDNVTFARYLYPKLNTIDYPIYDMGQMSAQWVLKNVYKKPNIVIEHLFQPQLVIRHSVRDIP